MTKVDWADLDTWCDGNLVTRTGDELTVFKALDADLISGYQSRYPAVGPVECPDWRDDHECGGGLHFSPSIGQALGYHSEATRFLKCTVKSSEVRTIGSDKLKAPRAVVVCEVDRHGTPVGDQS